MKAFQRSAEQNRPAQQLYVTLYEARHHRLLHRQDVDYQKRGKMFSNFIILLKGSVRFDAQDGPIECKAGDFVYVPYDERYISHWTGNPEIEFLSLYFRFSAGSLPDMPADIPTRRQAMDEEFALQNITEMGGGSQQQDMISIVEGWASAHMEDRLMALSRLYRGLATAYPYLKRRQRAACPPAILPAVDYMIRHFEGNEKVGFYASLCHLSESRFYSLFSMHMHYTPIEYRNLLRAYEAGTLLRDTGLSVEDISARLGFESPEYFRRVFKQHYRQSPSAFRKRIHQGSSMTSATQAGRTSAERRP